MNSLRFVFEKRFEMEVYRPIGLEWWHEGYWAIFDHPDTAKQFLDLEQAFVPEDGTPVLNKALGGGDGRYLIKDNEYGWHAPAITLEAFKATQFDYLICSIPQHVAPFIRLRDEFQPNAKVIFQAGNDWPLDGLPLNGVDGILASIEPQQMQRKIPVVWYHQEFDTSIFKPTDIEPTGKVTSFINVLEQTPGWEDFKCLENFTRYFGMEWKSYGGQCRDGCIDGASNMAKAIQESEWIFHVKHTGDGFGHIIHNAYACGRPVIIRRSHYRGKLAERLLAPGTFIDLDRFSLAETKNMLHRMHAAPELLIEAGQKAAARFAEVVNYDNEAQEIKKFLEVI